MRLGIFILDLVWDSIGTALHIRGDWILTKSTRTVVNVLVCEPEKYLRQSQSRVFLIKSREKKHSFISTSKHLADE